MGLTADQQRHGRWTARWWPFVALCLLGSARWLIDDRWPAAASSLASQSAGCGAAAMCSLGFAFLVRLRKVATGSEESFWRNALGGLLLLSGPAISLILLPRELDSGTLMIALSVTPVVAGVASVALGDAGDVLAGFLWPGLAAMAGMLLILPQPSVADPTADLAMFLAPVFTGVGAALLGHEGRCTGEAESLARLAPGVVAALSAAALFFGALTLARYGAEGTRSLVTPLAATLDGALAWLAVATARRLGAMRFSAISSLVPLVVLLEGIVLMRPTLTTRMEIGLVLLLIAGVTLLLRGGDDPEESEASILDLS